MEGREGPGGVGGGKNSHLDFKNEWPCLGRAKEGTSGALTSLMRGVAEEGRECLESSYNHRLQTKGETSEGKKKTWAPTPRRANLSEGRRSCLRVRKSTGTTCSCSWGGLERSARIEGRKEGGKK